MSYNTIYKIPEIIAKYILEEKSKENETSIPNKEDKGNSITAPLTKIRGNLSSEIADQAEIVNNSNNYLSSLDSSSDKLIKSRTINFTSRNEDILEEISNNP